MYNIHNYMHDSILVTWIYMYNHEIQIYMFFTYHTYIYIYIYIYIYTHIPWYIHSTKCNYVSILICDRNTKYRKIHVSYSSHHTCMKIQIDDIYIYVWMVSIRQYVCSLISEMKYTTIHILINRIKKNFMSHMQICID